jgi:transposase
VFQNSKVVIRSSRAASVVADVLAGHRPSIWVPALCCTQQEYADLWQVCQAHQLHDCQFTWRLTTPSLCHAKMLLLRAIVLARRREEPTENMRPSYQYRLNRDMNAIMVLAIVNQHNKRLRDRYGETPSDPFILPEYPNTLPNNNGSKRELYPATIYRKSPAGSDRFGAPVCLPISGS